MRDGARAVSVAAVFRRLAKVVLVGVLGRLTDGDCIDTVLNVHSAGFPVYKGAFAPWHRLGSLGDGLSTGTTGLSHRS